MSTQAPPPATARLARARPRQNELVQSQTRGPGSLASSLLESPVVRLLPLLALFVVVSLLTDPGRPNGDEVPILAAAHRLLQGRYAVVGTMDSTQYLWHGPGLPALLAPLVALGIPLAELRLTSPLLMFAAALLFYRFLRLRLTRRGALIGAYALGLYAPGYYVLGTVAKDPLALLCAIAAFDGTARYLMHGRRRHAVVAGLALGALVMTRLEYGWVVSGCLIAGLVWWCGARFRHGAAAERTAMTRRWTAICAVGMLACVPWLAYTYVITHHFFYWGNSGGISLYWMSSPSPSQLGQWHAPHTVNTDPALAGYRPFFHYVSSLGPLQGDLKLQHVALAQAVAHPAKYLLNLLANVGRMFLGFPFSFKLSVAVVTGLALFNGALLAALMAAAVSLRRARRPLPPEALPYLLFFGLGLAVHLLPTAEPRMVVPLIPIPLWLIGQAFYRRSQASSFLFREDGFERSLDRLLAAVDVQQTAGGAGVAEQSSQDGGHVVARDLTPEGR
ncbi:MAG: hypothetical protein E6G05_14355 [Actinobacteria bacterium]|nr:MAG: hypothetical protein E6G05_14355 [Actinomycetota bacterium]